MPTLERGRFDRGHAGAGRTEADSVSNGTDPTLPRPPTVGGSSSRRPGSVPSFPRGALRSAVQFELELAKDDKCEAGARLG